NLKMYRYSIRKHNKATVNRGEIRIGTLYDFRNTEHGKGIKDPLEGKKTVSITIENTDSKSVDDMVRDNKPLLDKFGCSLSMGGTGSIGSVKSSKLINSPDCFILCTSKYKSLQTMEQFECANSCLEIVNIHLFYDCLTTALIDKTGVKLEFKGIYEVTYKNREEEWNGNDFGINPIFIKAEDSMQQGELRAIWQPLRDVKIKPIVITNKRIAKHCKLLFFL
ncbi:MAG: hypothetical protein ACXWT3_12130, partial [Methylococcaceae bacterium]